MDEIELNEAAIATSGGKSTQTKKLQDFQDLKSFKNAQQQIKVIDVVDHPGSTHKESFPKPHSGSKK